jgi:hypothetical protein
MKSEFTEKEYEVAFTFQFLEHNESALDNYPIMPSSRVEGSYPFDVCFNLRQNEFRYSILFQFKNSNYFKKRRRDNYQFFEKLDPPIHYFKIWSRAISDQHELMQILRRSGYVLW